MIISGDPNKRRKKHVQHHVNITIYNITCIYYNIMVEHKSMDQSHLFSSCI